MSQYIYHSQITLDQWHFLPEPIAQLSAPKQVIGVGDFLAAGCKVPDFSFGLTIHSVEDFDQLRQAFKTLPSNLELINCQFKGFKNGFFYSIANILRQEMHYNHELRATGEVYFDHLDYLIRSGFDGFDFGEFKDAKKLELAKEWIKANLGKPHYFDQYFQNLANQSLTNQPSKN